MARAYATVSLFVAILVAPAAEAAVTKQACVDAATRGQIQRDDGKLTDAVEAFTVCTDAACPSAVRQSCVDWLADVRSKFPQVTLHLTRPDASARARVDGTEASFDAPLTL